MPIELAKQTADEFVAENADIVYDEMIKLGLAAGFTKTELTDAARNYIYGPISLGELYFPEPK